VAVDDAAVRKQPDIVDLCPLRTHPAIVSVTSAVSPSTRA
jgi:hypothetical protein